MRAIKRVLAIGALAAPLVIGCAGLASAHEGHEGHEGPEAHFSQSHFVANEEVAGESKVFSEVEPGGVEHGEACVFAGDEGVEGSHTESGAHF
ncbi:hypothetical protein ACFYS8_15780 [Kitasatospora sp. NPDC004615]|uniref:hypothetical protein n=1 Tax=unclassified Kitasatospora TaxID=2633591 RepID=UPI0036A12757